MIQSKEVAAFSRMCLWRFYCISNNSFSFSRLFLCRFYFLSNDELLHILSQTKDPRAVQPHLSKCFENVVQLDMDEETMEISAMNSAEKEKVCFVSFWMMQCDIVSALGGNSELPLTMNGTPKREENATLFAFGNVCIILFVIVVFALFCVCYVCLSEIRLDA